MQKHNFGIFKPNCTAHRKPRCRLHEQVASKGGFCTLLDRSFAVACSKRPRVEQRQS
jgi:hypothetical protein